MEKEITRNDEEKFLEIKIAKNHLFTNPVSYDDIIEEIKNHKLELEIKSDDGTAVLDEDNYKEIKKIFPSLYKIIKKPKTFLKVKEEKMPVEIVKRINYKAMIQLGRNSNDWHARTITSIRPKNILTDNNEETLELYENKVVCSLIDKIDKLIRKRKRYYLQEKTRIEQIIDNRVINESYYNYYKNSFPFYKSIIKNNDYDFPQKDYLSKIARELLDIESTQFKIKNIKKSNFYKALRNKHRVPNHIKKTNIFVFDINYNKVYKLWNYLNEYHEDLKIEPKTKISQDLSENNYNMYCFICILSSLCDMGYYETSKNKMLFSNGIINDFKPLMFENGDNILKLWCTNQKIHISYLYDKENKREDEIIIHTDYMNFEEKRYSEISLITHDILKDLTYNKSNNVSSQYEFISFNMNNYDDTKVFTDRICKRFYSIGNYFSPDENINDLNSWGDYKTGISIISPVNLRYNFIRIEKLINYLIYKHVDLQNIKSCPLCGGTNIKRINNYEVDYICKDCDHKISYTYCNNCDSSHKKPILWIEYKDQNFLSKKDIINNEIVNLQNFRKINKIEGIMGANAITAFELEEKNGEWKLKTICPRCGQQLGKIK